MTNKKLFISHPLKSHGDPEANTLEVERIAALIIEASHGELDVYYPHRIGMDAQARAVKQGHTAAMFEEYWMDYAIRMMLECDAMVMGGDWIDSTGCKKEWNSWIDNDPNDQRHSIINLPLNPTLDDIRAAVKDLL